MDPQAGMSDDGDMPMPMPMMPGMTMFFYQSESVHFLFKSYNVTTGKGYFSVLLVAFIFGFMTETLSIVQDRLDQFITAKVRESKVKFRGQRLSQGFVFILRVWLSYCCMLAVMTYNVGVIFAVILGLTTGYFILGFTPSEVIVLENTLNADLKESKESIN